MRVGQGRGTEYRRGRTGLVMIAIAMLSGCQDADQKVGGGPLADPPPAALPAPPPASPNTTPPAAAPVQSPEKPAEKPKDNRPKPPERVLQYNGIETRLLDGDLVQFIVTMGKGALPTDLSRYAECAAAQYALIRGYGFARHVRTNVDARRSKPKADAVYTISASLPRGLKTIDAEVKLGECREAGIPSI